MLIDDVNDIDESKSRVIARIKKELYQHITETCNFPEWKQLNYIKQQLRDPGNTKIAATNAWMDELMDYMDTVEGGINAAANKLEMSVITKQLKFTPRPQ